MAHKALGLLAALLLVTACSSTLVDPAAKGAALEPLTTAQIVERATDLMRAREFGDERIHDMLVDLKAYLASDTFKERVGEGVVTGVIAYNFGAGGFIVGSGGVGMTASFNGGSDAVEAEGSITTVGGVIGGKVGWGVGLLCNLEHQGWFIGEYQGGGAGATAGESTVAGAVLHHEQFGHTIRTVGGGAGLMAAAGSSSLEISWADAE